MRINLYYRMELYPAAAGMVGAAPVQSAETRARIIDQVAETDTAFLTAHFPTPTAGRIVRSGEAFRFEDI